MSPITAESSVPKTAARKAGSALQRLQGALRRGWRSFAAHAESLARQRPLLFAAALVTLLFALVIWLMPPAFQTNDDAIMCMIASGQGISLSPDEHLVFTNALIGKMLKTLYTEIPSFPWYGWYLVATQWVATIALLYCLLRPRYTRLSLLGFAAYFSTAGIYFLVNLQFTSTGCLAGITGGLLLLQVLRHAWPSRGEQTALAIAGALFLVWGGLIRSDIFPLTLLIVCPMLLTAIWASSFRREAAIGVSLSLALACGAMFFAQRFHEATYSDQAWKDFYQYNPLRIKFNDEQWVNYLPENKHVFDQVGWSKIDFEMIQGWYYDDPQYDHAKLSAVLNNHTWALERDIPRTLQVAAKEMLRNTAFVGMLFAMLGAPLFFVRGQRRFAVCGAAFVSAWGMMLAITLFKKAPPERVYMPVLAYPWLVALFTLAPGWRGVPTQRGAFARLMQQFRTSWRVRNWSWFKPGAMRHMALRTVSLLIFIGLVMSVRKQQRVGREHARHVAQYTKMLDEMRPDAAESERLILTFGSDFPYEYQAALFGRNDYSGIRFFSLGWPQRTPIAERMKAHFQIETMGRAIATNPRLKLVIHPNAYIRIIDYLAEHYSSALRIVNEKENKRYALTRVEPRELQEVSESSPESTIWLAIPTLKRLGLLR